MLAAGIAIFVAIAVAGWMLDRPLDTPWSSAAGVGLQGWYLAHGVTLPVSWGVLSLPPLGLTAALAYLHYRSGRAAAASLELRTWRAVAESLAAMVITYATVAVMLTAVVYSPSNSPGLIDTAVRSGLLTAIAAGAGLTRESGLGAKALGRLPGPAAAYTRAARATGYGLLAASAVVVAVAMLVGFSEASAITAALAPAGPAGITIAGLSIAYLPNALLAAAGIGAGATLTIGGSSISLLGSDLGPVPAFPLLAALPDGAGVWSAALIPLVGAALGGLVLVRQLERSERGTFRLIAGASGSAALAATVLGALTWWAAGALGDGALASVGPSPLSVWLLSLVVLTLGTSVVAVVASARGVLPATSADRTERRSRRESRSLAKDPEPQQSAERALRRLTALPGSARGGTGPVSTAPAASLSIVRKARSEQAKAS